MRKRADVSGELSEKEFLLERRRIEIEMARIEAEVPAALRPRRDYQEDQLDLARAQFEYDKAAEDLETVRPGRHEAEVEELRLAFKQAEDEIAVAEQAIEALTLEAPRDGILVVAENGDEGRKFQVGDNAWVGLAVMSIPDLSAMKVVARLSRTSMTTVSRSVMPARATAGRLSRFDGRGSGDRDRPHRTGGKRRVATAFVPRGDPISSESDPERMRPGMSVRVEVLPQPLGDVVVVPREALELADPPRVHLADGATLGGPAGSVHGHGVCRRGRTGRRARG